MKRALLISLICATSFALQGCQAEQNAATEQSVKSVASVIDNTSRSERNKQRDQYRNPVETLEFFGIQPDMTVVEISPGGGWYSEILGAYLADQGQLYAAHFPANSDREFYQRSRAAFAERIASDSHFSNIILTEFSPSGEVAIAPDASADMVLTFRNLHNWYMGGEEAAIRSAFQQFYVALKPGGVLGVVEHRLPEQRPDADMLSSGYMKESLAIRIAEEVGFELVASSDINANPLDTADHPRGVWTLPPSLRLGDQDREKYLAIGESDRFTLKFQKPATKD